MAKKSTTGKVMTGMTITAAVAAAAAGAYFLYGTPEGKKQRKMVKSWALKARGEVLERLENLKVVNEGAYHNVVDAVTKKYKSLKDVNPAELAAMARELKGHWKSIQRELISTKQTVKKIASRGKSQAKKVKKAVRGIKRKSAGRKGAKSKSR